MFTHTYHTGQSPQVRLAECTGRLTIEPWAERGIAIEAEAQPEHAELEGETLVIRHGRGSILLRVPADTAVAIADHTGDVARRASRRWRSSAPRAASTPSASAARCGCATSTGRPASRRGGADDRARHQAIRRAALEACAPPYHGPQHGHDRDRRRPATTCRSARRSRPRSALSAATPACARSRAICGWARSAATAPSGRSPGAFSIGPVGGNAEIQATGGVHEVGNIGGNLMLEAAPLIVAAGASAQIIVGGNARLVLPNDADLSIHAIIGGVVYGAGISSLAIGMATISYGAGRARLDLTVGGNLELQGGDPQISSMLGGVRARPGKLKTPPPRLARRPSARAATKARAARSCGWSPPGISPPRRPSGSWMRLSADERRTTNDKRRMAR